MIDSHIWLPEPLDGSLTLGSSVADCEGTPHRMWCWNCKTRLVQVAAPGGWSQRPIYFKHPEAGYAACYQRGMELTDGGRYWPSALR